MKTIVIESPAVPYVHLQIVRRSGALHDPPGRNGLAYTSGQALLHGTRLRTRDRFNEALDELGAELSVSVGRETLVVDAEVLSRNVEPLLQLIGEALLKPAFDEGELGLVQRQTRADLEQVRDSDPELCADAFRRHLWGEHPYGRPIEGTLRTVGSFIRDEAVGLHESHLCSDNLLIGAAGDITKDRLAGLLKQHLPVPEGPPPAPIELGEPPGGDGVRALLVDKPDRSQTQVRWGHPCLHASHPDFLALMVGSTIFGGTFTARLMQEIREKRGWSYGAYSRVQVHRRTGAFVFAYYPATQDAAPALVLGQQLFADLVDKGVTQDELDFVKSYLSNAFAFQIETPARRMWQHLQIELLDRPADFLDTYVEHVSALTLDDVNSAIRTHLRPDALALTVVCTASSLRDDVAALPGVSDVKVVPYDHVV